MKSTTKSVARERRNALRRKTFKYVENGIPLYDRPCGCTNGAYLPDGVMEYRHASSVVLLRDDDLIECLQCRAVWTHAEIKPLIEQWHLLLALADVARRLGFPANDPDLNRLFAKAQGIPEVEAEGKKPIYVYYDECGCGEEDCVRFGEDVDKPYYDHGERWAPVNIGPHDIEVPKCSTCSGLGVVDGCEDALCPGVHICSDCSGSCVRY